EGSSPITIIGPKGRLDLQQGCIIALRHIHFSIEDAEKLGINDKDYVKILAGKNKGRTTIFSDVFCRVGKEYATECHLDIDEANAANVDNNDYIYIIEKL
ncbi:MAG: PduL/EutD family phosphate acyltransferase, partial [bacterium]|nr:PduL/EutD family phosphate acyltransferase [bacterium]